MTTDLVGPLPTIRFHDGTKVVYQPPRDTCDQDRWRRCTDHHPACDCREAEMAEEISELRSRLKDAEESARKALAGHPIWVYEDGPNGEREVGCKCTGCVIVRASHLLSHSDGSSMHRDETDGLTEWQRECEARWKVCLSPCPNVGLVIEPNSYDLEYVTRDRGPFHEHLEYPSGHLARRSNPDWMPF